MQRILRGALAGLAGGIAGAFVMDEVRRLCFGVRQEPAAMRVARRFGVESENRWAAGIHYVVGALGGAAFGAAAEWMPPAAAGFGSLFGVSVWILGDEIAMPLSGLTAIPVPEPRSPRLAAIATHTAYGLTTEAVRRTIEPLVLR